MDVVLKKYFWVVNLTVIALCAMFAGRAFSHVLVGAFLAGDDPPRPKARLAAGGAQPKTHDKATDAIVKRNLFCSGCAPVVETPAGGGGSDGGDPNQISKSSLQLELVSTMVSPDDDEWSMAVIRDLSDDHKDVAMYNRGKKVAKTEAEIHRVLRRRVYLKNGGRLEYLDLGDEAPAAAAGPSVASLPPPPPGPQPGFDPNLGDIDKGVSCSGNACSVERQLVDKLLANTTMLATAARFVPSIKDGKPNGFKLYAIRPNSIFGKIGLQNGDTVKAINGLDMTSPDKALEVYTKLRNASHLSVSVERRGESMTLDYSIR
jgi:general secretion pathway protein C